MHMDSLSFGYFTLHARLALRMNSQGCGGGTQITARPRTADVRGPTRARRLPGCALEPSRDASAPRPSLKQPLVATCLACGLASLLPPGAAVRKRALARPLLTLSRLQSMPAKAVFRLFMGAGPAGRAGEAGPGIASAIAVCLVSRGWRVELSSPIATGVASAASQSKCGAQPPPVRPLPEGCPGVACAGVALVTREARVPPGQRALRFGWSGEPSHHDHLRSHRGSRSSHGFGRGTSARAYLLLFERHIADLRKPAVSGDSTTSKLAGVGSHPRDSRHTQVQ